MAGPVQESSSEIGIPYSEADPNSGKLEQVTSSGEPSLTCPQCNSTKLWRDGIRLLGTLANKGANLQDPESVKEIIAKQQEWTTKTKEIAVETYSCFLKMQGKTWS